MNGENGGIEKYRRLQPHAIPPESRANLIPKVRVPDDTPEIFQVPGGDERRYAQRLLQEFLDRLPIVCFPSRSQNFRLAFRKARMIEHDLGPGALHHELELRNRIDAWSPAARSPGLHDSLVRHKFDLSSRDVPPEERERASHFTTDLRGLVSEVHGLHGSTELYDFVELFGVSERFVDAFPGGFESSLLVNGFRRMRNLIVGSRPSIG